MAETIDLVRDSTMQETNRILTLIAGKEGGFTPKSWKDVQLIVRQGLAKTYFSVGDQFTVEKATAINATVRKHHWRNVRSDVSYCRYQYFCGSDRHSTW